MRKLLLVLGGLSLLAVAVFLIVKVGPYLAMAASLQRAMSAADVEELAQREEAVLARWRDELTAGAEPWEHYPPTEVNQSALDLESIASELGTDCATSHHETTPPEATATASWQQVEPEIKKYLENLRTSASAKAPALPPGLDAWLHGAHGEVDRARELLLTSEPPQWERDLEAGAEAPLPNLLCQLKLHRVLLLGALEAADPERAASSLEAAWRLRQAAEANPAPIAQLIHYIELGDELSVLRRSCAVGGPWEERLLALEPRAAILRSLRLEGWLAHQTFRNETMFFGEADRDGELPMYSRLLIVGYLEDVQHTVDELERQNPLTHDPEAFVAALEERTPRWSILARLLRASPGPWLKAVRTELVIEHTLRILAAQETLARGREPAATRTPSVAVPGLTWTDEPTAAGFRIALDGDLDDGNRAPVALEFVLDRGACASETGAP